MTGRRPYVRTGLHALRSRVKVMGLAAIDRRTHGARALLAWRQDLIADLGGENAVSAQQRALVEIAARTKLYVDHLDAWLMERRSLINAKKKAAHPLLLQRQQLADSLAKYMSMLGLERVPTRVPTLQEYLQTRNGTIAAPGATEGPTRATRGEDTSANAAPDGHHDPGSRGVTRETEAG